MLRLKLATRGTGPGSTSSFAIAGLGRVLGCLAVALGLLLIAPAAGSANPITDENAKTGTAGWEVGQADSPNIDGYTDKTSIAPGESLTFRVSTSPSATYRIKIYRLGWYNGAGARLVGCLGSTFQAAPTCTTTSTGSGRSTPGPNGQTGQIDASHNPAGGSWPVTNTLSTSNTANWTTGEYVAEYTLVSGSQAGFARYSPFVVRSNAPQASASNILVVVPFNTYNAYNLWGGTSAYDNTTSPSGPYPPATHDHATKVSFNRPFARREWRFWDYNLVRFLEKEGYDVSYASDTDVDANPSILLQHRTVIVSGHSEYWTKAMRNGFDSARDQGTNIVFAGANNAYWQVRYEDSGCADDNTVCNTVGDQRTMVIYKGPNEGPNDPLTGTGNETSKFRELGRPECELQGGVQYGSWFPNDGYTDYTTTAAGASDPWSAGTGLTQGSIIHGLVGFEFDSFDPNCQASGTPTVLFQYQGAETSADIDAAAVKYVDSTSGARVFSSGTEQWAWGLDSYRWDPTLFTGIPATNPAIIQFTKNMLADMAKPAAPGSVSATKVGNSFNIDTTPRPDPRISSYRIYRHAGSGSFQPGDPGVTQVCLSDTDGDCTDSPASGTYRYASVAVDQWNASTAALSGTVDNLTPPTAVNDSATVSEDAAPTSVPVTANDTNPSGQAITITNASDPAHGTVAITGGGTGLTYQPDPNYCNNPPGTSLDTFTYTINGGTSATVSMTVTCVDDPPVAVRDPLSVVEDDPATANTLNVTANDADIDGGLKEITSFTQPAHGTVTGVGTAGHWTDVRYQPSPNYCNFKNGVGSTGPSDDFTYTLNGGSSNTVAMTVDCRDDLANAVDDSATVTEDASATAVPVLSNDSDVEGDPFSILTVTQPAHGTVAITGGGTGLTYQPNPNYCGPDPFTYTVTGGDTATVSMTVTCVNDPPVAVNDSATFNEDAAAAPIPVLTNDTDVENDAKTISSATDPAHGTVTLSGGTAGARTTLTYQPDAEYCNNPPGTTLDTFQYTINGGSVATVSVTVNCIDDAPVPHNDAAGVNEDAAATAVDVLANDTDVDGGPKTINSVTQPPNGTVEITGGGTGVTYLPNPNYCNNNGGTADKFTYTLNGGNTGTVSMTVFCVDDAPVAAHDSRSLTEDDAATALTLLANDTDIDGGTKEVASFTQPTHGTVTGVGTSGHWTDLKYQPNANYCNFPGGAPSDDFTYTLNGGSVATVSITVDCVDDRPVANNDSATVTEDDSATSIPVMGNDTDVDGGPMGILSVTQPANGTVDTSGNGAVLTYKPNANYCNTPPGTNKDTFTYTLNGGNTATVSMTVNCVDDDPVAVNDSASATEGAGATTVPVLTNDTDIDAGPKTITSAGPASHGTVNVTGGGSGLTYTVSDSYCDTPSGPPISPSDSFSYTLNGGSTATVSMTLVCVDDPPHAVNDSDTVAGNSAANSIGVLANDTDVDSGPKSISSFTQPSHGVVDGTGPTNAWTDLTYDPTNGYCGPDSFSYTDNGGSSATVSITVDCSGAPTAVDDSKTVTEDANATAIDVIANDTDTDGGTNTVDSTTQPANGSVVITGGGSGLTYKPNANYCNTQSGGTADTFNYTLNGGSTGQVSVTVTCVDDAPVATNDVATTAEDAGATTVLVLANDNDIDGGPKTVSSVTQGAHGTVAIADGGNSVTYDLDEAYCDNASGPPASPSDSFTYKLNGGSQGTVSVTITCTDDSPSAVDDSFTVLGESSSNPLTVLANDTDADAGPKAITEATDPDHGTVHLTGSTSLTYTPDPGYCSDPGTTDDFGYTLSGGSSATVHVTVDCSQPPVANDDTASVNEGDTLTPVPVLSNDTDPDGGAKTIGSVTQGAHGAVAITGGGTGLTYNLNNGYCDNPSGPPANPSDSFTYTLNGGDSATVSVTITCVDDNPVANDDSGTASENGGASAISVLGNDTDVDAGPKKIDSATDGAHGSVLVAGDGSGLSYTVNQSYCDNVNGPPANPSDTFTYTPNGGSTGHVSVDITCADDNPDAVDDDATVSGNSGANTLQVLSNDTDVDAGPKQIDPTLVQEPDHGTVAIAGNGLSLTYTPEPGYCSPTGTTDNFDYKLDPGGDTARVRVTVDCSQPPHAVDDAATVAQGAPATNLLVLANDFDTDGGPPMTITAVTQPANGSVAMSGDHTSLTYQPNGGYCNNGSPTDNFTYTLNGAPTASVFMTVTCAPSSQAPVQQKAPAAKKCKKGQKKVKGKCKKKKKKRKARK
jgi:VCBS repeat-containing protein